MIWKADVRQNTCTRLSDFKVINNNASIVRRNLSVIYFSFFFKSCCVQSTPFNVNTGELSPRPGHKVEEKG